MSTVGTRITTQYDVVEWSACSSRMLQFNIERYRGTSLNASDPTLITLSSGREGMSVCILLQLTLLLHIKG